MLNKSTISKIAAYGGIAVAIILFSFAVFASDFCKERVVKECNISGLDCQMVVVCE